MTMKIVRGMPSVEYHSMPAANSSKLKEILRSPAHVKFSIENGKTSDAFVVGEAVHAAILEPLRFKEQYVTAPDVDRRTKDGRAAWQMFIDANPGKIILTYDQMLSVSGMSESAMQHLMAHELIATLTETELTLVWEQIGVRCKARIDGYSLEHRAIIDLKTSGESVAPDAFARTVANLKYHVQAAWYIDAMRAAGFDVETVIFIAIEKSGPYGVACYSLDDQAIEEGRIAVARALPILANCMTTNDWPGYDQGVQTISLPKWSIKGEEVGL
jgi:exodeoxyribonuclease VIII